jgi:pimeloyl-ACP methyl ester carboxylesterase
MNPREPASLSIYDRLARTSETLRTQLAAGQPRRELIALLGQSDYQQLARLARTAARTRIQHEPIVYVIPGILGTQLSAPRRSPWPADLLWVDPADIMAGRLHELALPEHAGLKTAGAVAYSYLPLQLRLQAAGFDARLYEFDWRWGLPELGAELAALLRAERSRPIALIGHSMGGLVARAALAGPGLEHVRTLITLGAPHGGSFAVVQALRGTYPVVRRLAALDQRHDAETLTRDVFSTFASLYQMLPHQGTLTEFDLYEPANWPREGLTPDATLLHAARTAGRLLAPADERLICVCGVRQRTVTGLKEDEHEFHYAVSSAGDGTVPVAAASLGNAPCYYVHCEHSELPRSERIARAVAQLLLRGRTDLLSARWKAARERPVMVSDTALRALGATKVDWAALSPAARRAYLNRLSEAPAAYAGRSHHAHRGARNAD